MTDIPSDHPVITIPQKAVANNSLLLAPGSKVKSNVKGGPNIKRVQPKKPITDENKIINILYPKGEMSHVTIDDFEYNPNLIIRSLKIQLGAWTNSYKKIYLNYLYPQYIIPYILKHEAEHVLQFKSNGKPISYIAMLKYEMKAYPNTENWMKDKSKVGGYQKYINELHYKEGDYLKALEAAEIATKTVRLLNDNVNKGKIVKINEVEIKNKTNIVKNTNITRPASGLTKDQIVHKNFIINNFLPPQLLKDYKIDDLFSQINNNTHWNSFGYKIDHHIDNSGSLVPD